MWLLVFPSRAWNPIIGNIDLQRKPTYDLRKGECERMIYLEMDLALVDPADNDVRTVDRAVLGKPEPDVALRPGLHLEGDILPGDAPQQPIVVVEKDRVVPVGGRRQ